VTQPGEHLPDEVLSALIDDRLAPEDLPQARSHADACATCQARLDELQSVVALLHALPSVEPPHGFALGPQLVVDPPNVIRLRRWYTIARASAASLAAAFVFLSVGTLYIDSRPADSRQKLAVASQRESAPAPVQTLAAPAPTNAPGLAPRAAGAPAAAPGAAGTRSLAAGGAADSADQVAAATSGQPLPTPSPTTAPSSSPPASFAAEPVGSAQVDAAAPLRAAAALVGVLVVLGILAALVVRHRLVAASNLPRE
jgi:hypothetical protein